MDAWFKNLISREERDCRIAEIEADTKFYQDVALGAETSVQSVTAEDLANALSPFYESEFLSNSEKRQLLQASVPEIHVRGYQMEGMTVLGSTFDRNKVNHTAAGYFLAERRLVHLPLKIV